MSFLSSPHPLIDHDEVYILLSLLKSAMICEKPHPIYRQSGLSGVSWGGFNVMFISYSSLTVSELVIKVCTLVPYNYIF